VGHPERRLEEASKHGLQGVIAPVDSGGSACEVTTLRQALAVGLEGARPSPTARKRPTSERGGAPVISLVGDSEGPGGPRILRPAPEVSPHGELQPVPVGDERED
jgi:hypothetical protein